jgi:hypothetical protein
MTDARTIDHAGRHRIEHYLRDWRMRGGSSEHADPELYQQVRQRVLEGHPTHSLHRSALIHQLYHELLGGAELSGDKFAKQLERLKISRASYLAHARMMATKHGYVAEKLSFADNGDHKLRYESPKGARYFGKAGYGDYIIYQHQEREGEVERGYAAKKRKVFRESHEAISKIHKLDRYSPNELALNILW